MIQILGIRLNPKTNKKTDAFWGEHWRAPSVAEILANPDKYLEKVPKRERWNLYYTVALCTDKKRELMRQEVMPFDVDPPKGEYIAEEQFAAYIGAVCSVLGIEAGKVGTVFSGGGLQFLVGLNTPFTDESFFDSYREHYRAICKRINEALGKLGLPGTADTSVFSAARLFRMPNTENRKETRKPTMARVLQPHIEPVDFSLTALSEIPVVKKKDQLADYGVEGRASKFPEPDTASILSGCEFIKHCKESPNSVSEPQWYAALSVVARLPDGNKLSHEISQGHAKYSHSETESKIEQALKASGPRTCSNINVLWDGCSRCPYYEKVQSPILIQGPDHVKTKNTGFHNVFVTKDGVQKVGKPNYKDLLTYFDKSHRHIVLDSSGIVYVWRDTHYHLFEDLRIKAFAQDHFEPPANNKMCAEFKELVTRTAIRSSDFFTETTRGRMNFLNGVYTRATGELTPHDPNLGFRYCLPYEYDPEAKAPQFEKFLREVTGGDESLQKILLEFMGYAFSNDTCWLAKVLLLTGEGANGKSTFLNVMKELAGKANYSALNMGEIKSETNRQLMDGKLFNLAEETPSNALIENSVFKNIVAGGEMQVRALYKSPYSITNKTKLVFATNSLPPSRDTTKGFFRRLVIAPFNQTFEEGNRDPHILEKLVTELPGIFNLVMLGYDRLLKQKALTESAAATKEIERYHEEICTVTRWKLENVQVLKPTSERSIVKRDLYQAYAAEVKAMGDEPDNDVLFGKKMRRLIPDYEKRDAFARIQGKMTRIIRGIVLGADAQPEF